MSEPSELPPRDDVHDDSGSGSYYYFFLMAIPAFVVLALVVMSFLPKLPEARLDSRGGMTPGEVAPEIKAAGWLNGAPPDLNGKVVVIELWATWCQPCRLFAPEMVKLHSKYRDKGVVFVGLSVEDEQALPEMERWVSELGITWPNGYGAEETIEQLRMESIPVFWVIGSDGKIAWNVDSPLSPEDAIEEALKKSKNKSG